MIVLYYSLDDVNYNLKHPRIKTQRDRYKCFFNPLYAKGLYLNYLVFQPA